MLSKIILSFKLDCVYINFKFLVIMQDTVPPIGFAIICRKNNVVDFLLKQNVIDRTLDGLSGPIVMSVKVENFECTRMMLDCLGGPEKVQTKAQELGMQELNQHIGIFVACYPQVDYILYN